MIVTLNSIPHEQLIGKTAYLPYFNCDTNHAFVEVRKVLAVEPRLESRLGANYVLIIDVGGKRGLWWIDDDEEFEIKDEELGFNQ